jgi:N-methylhydantoinase A/oxoprolinase/acetone carboxylase beta subunit
MNLRLGFDTGGTYTDAVLYDPAAGVVASAKALTTRHDLAIGLGGALAALKPRIDRPIGLVSLSTTLATNALVEGHGQPIGLILIGYPASVLDGPPLQGVLAEDRVAMIGGGHDPLGDEQRPLDVAAAEAAIAMHAGAVAAFAVSGYFSVRNPAHEIAVRDLIRRRCDRPVSCGHELSAQLDAPRRALTALLNARLIPQLKQLIEAVQALLADSAIDAPLMVVKGDGSLIGASVAMECPVETILSGPAASVVGARHLAGVDDVFVADMGGTTTDIAVLREGRPVLNRDGAIVGGFRTMVEAIEVRSFGLGGDSEVHLRNDGGLRLGPRRAVPLSLLATLHPDIVTQLAGQLAGDATTADGQFLLRQRPLDLPAATLPEAQRRLWEALAGGPVPASALPGGYANDRALARLIDRGLVIRAAMTPSDAAHVVGRQADWCREAARLGGMLLARQLGVGLTAEAVAERIIEQVIRQSAEALLDTAFGRWRPGEAVIEPGRKLIDEAIAGPQGRTTDLFTLAIALAGPIVAIGAPAGTYYPAVADRLGTTSVVPPFAEVCNAVGAVVGGIVRTVQALITTPEEGRYRVHLPSQVSDFVSLEGAAAFALATLRGVAEAQARQAGAVDLQLKEERRDKIVEGVGGLALFIESRVAVTALGRPRLATEPIVA